MAHGYIKWNLQQNNHTQQITHKCALMGKGKFASQINLEKFQCFPYAQLFNNPEFNIFQEIKMKSILQGPFVLSSLVLCREK